MGAFVISPLPLLVERNVHRTGPFPPRAFCCARIDGTTPRSATLMPSLPLPTHGYRPDLFGEVSSAGTEGFSCFRMNLRSMSPLRPRRWVPPHWTRLVRHLLP